MNPLLSARVIACGFLLACSTGDSSLLPTTPLGRFAGAWLFAHNRGDGHAMVHFTLENRGSRLMTGSQVDSAVYDGVRFARELGQLVPVKVLQSTDTSLAILLRSNTRGLWRTDFRSAPQPSLVKVRVEVMRADSLGSCGRWCGAFGAGGS